MKVGGAACHAGKGPLTAAGAAGYYSWADLIRRVFQKDVHECVRCGGRLKLVATILEVRVVRAMLECIGLPTRAPPLAPARGPWQGALDFDGG